MAATNALIALFCLICVKYLVLVNATQFIKWNNLPPGDLLHRLDALTESKKYEQVQRKHYPIRKRTIMFEPNKHRNIQRFQKRSDADLSMESPYDYDSAYDAFVQKYFDESISRQTSTEENEEDDHNVFDSDNADKHEASEESQELVGEETKLSDKTEECKKVLRNKTHCIVCKNSRNGESSEKCSYSMETTPRRYEIKKNKEYRKYRETSAQNKPVEDDFGKLPGTEGSFLTCRRYKMLNKLCYLCENHAGEKDKNCFSVPKEEIKSKAMP